MEDLNKYVSIYQEQLGKGDILIAYNALVKFVMRLRTDLIKSHSDQYAFTGILHGYLDYTYFYYTNSYLKSRKLKLGVVLNHIEMRFEVWLLGSTTSVQKQYWDLLKTSKWNENRGEMPKYSILEASLVDAPDFNDLYTLAQQIEVSVMQTSQEIIDHLKEVIE